MNHTEAIDILYNAVENILEKQLTFLEMQFALWRLCKESTEMLGEIPETKTLIEIANHGQFWFMHRNLEKFLNRTLCDLF